MDRPQVFIRLLPELGKIIYRISPDKYCTGDESHIFIDLKDKIFSDGDQYSHPLKFSASQ